MKMHPYWVSIRLITCTSPLTASTLSSISESHGSPKTNFTALKEKALNGCKSKHPFLREQRSKYTSDDL